MRSSRSSRFMKRSHKVWEDRLMAPCEKTMQTVLPAIKAATSIVLQERYGYSVNRIAQFLGLTPTTVSNYIRHKRSGAVLRIILSIPKLRNEIEELADTIVCVRKNKRSLKVLSGMLCRICRDILYYLEKEA